LAPFVSRLSRAIRQIDFFILRGSFFLRLSPENLPFRFEKAFFFHLPVFLMSAILFPFPIRFFFPPLPNTSGWRVDRLCPAKICFCLPHSSWSLSPYSDRVFPELFPSSSSFIPYFSSISSSFPFTAKFATEFRHFAIFLSFPCHLLLARLFL